MEGRRGNPAAFRVHGFRAWGERRATEGPRRFHNAGAGTMVATDSLRRELAARGFRRVRAWTRGVDLN